MNPRTAATETLKNLDYVELRHAHAGWNAGTRGTIVDACADEDAFSVEVVAEEGDTADIFEASSLELALIHRAPITG